MREKIKKNALSYYKEYSELMGTTLESLNIPAIPNLEWRSNGDSLKKFSVFERHTPVRISSDTTLNSKF